MKATIHHPNFTELTLNDRVRAAVMDIENPVFWKALFALTRAVFPALRTLRYADASVPSMDKLFFLSHRTTLAIEASMDILNDTSLFGSLDGDADLALEREMLELEEDEEEEEDVQPEGADVEVEDEEDEDE